MLPAIAAACVLTVVSAAKPPPWRSWISEFGHDVFTYPDWITDQMAACVCSRDAAGSFSCKEADAPIKPTELTFCVAKQYLLQRMPSFDQHYLPPAVTVHGKNMLDDNIAFALMANNASAFSRKLPLPLRLAYVLPYSSFHEPRNNWRPLFFSKFYNVTSETTSTIAAMQALLPHVFRDWSGNPPLSGDGESVGAGSGDGSSWSISWASSTAPPITGPFDFVAYGHGSCTAWSTMMTYVLRSVGVPARQVGTPCWNSALGGINFTGSAVSNPNVSKCWHGGSKSNGSMVFGNDYLNNHNWVELWDDIKEEWVHINTPPSSNTPNTGLCSWNVSTGCDFNPNTTSAPTGCEGASKLGKAMRDHPIISPSWSLPGDILGEEVLDGNTLTLSTGEPVSALVWAPKFENVLGEPLSHDGLRFINLTSQYRCHKPRTAKDMCGLATYCSHGFNTGSSK